MQLTALTIVFVFFMFLQDVKAQLRKYTGDESNEDHNFKDSTEMTQVIYEPSDWKKIDIDFLSSYYSQDGNNAAVTGGMGTEQLTDFTQKIKVSFPTSPQWKWNLDLAYDYYSSASTDNIDNIRSSDSSSDVRAQLAIGAQYSKDEYQEFGFRIGGSAEYDYSSLNLGFNYSWLSQDKNTLIGLNTQAFYDTWAIYLPEELRGRVSVDTDKRQSYNAAFNLNKVINRRVHMSFLAEATYMNGLLSTPFHRVYFSDQITHDIERLPGTRLKIPLGVKMNAYVSDRVILRTYYRYYWDDWGMQAHTASIEMPFKINRFFAIYPHYRFHTQTAIDHFAPYQVASAGDEFYTSDYDLSELSSHHYGLGILFGKADGITSFKMPFLGERRMVLDGIDLKYSHFDRSTGLSANIISLGLRFSF